MASSLIETNYLSICSSCSSEFDFKDRRKLKLLPCGHTLCLGCMLDPIPQIHCTTSICCPICQELCESSWVAPQINYKPAPVKKANETGPAPLEPSWCFTCASESKPGCLLIHYVMDMKAKTLMEAENLQHLKKEFDDLRDLKRANLLESIQKRKNVELYVSQILNALRSLETEMKRVEEENNKALEEMATILDKTFAEKEKIPENLLSDLLQEVEGSNADDTLETLKDKMRKSVRDSEEKLKLANLKADRIHQQTSTKISVKLLSENEILPNIRLPSWFEMGFEINLAKNQQKMTELKRNLLMISHLVFGIQIKNRRTVQPVGYAKFLAPFLPSPTTSSADPAKPQSRLSKNNPNLIYSKFQDRFGKLFIISVKHLGVLKGQIYIQSDGPASFEQLFIQELYEFCKQSPKALILQKGVAGFSAEMSLNGFPLTTKLNGTRFAEKISDVGTLYNSTSNSWDVIFPLDIRCSTDHNPAGAARPAYLFGHVVHGLDLLRDVAGSEDRGNYTVILEVD